MADKISNLKKAAEEWFWMTLASLSPIFLIWLFFIFKENWVDFKFFITNIFLDGPIFAYVSTLLAPFLFIAAKKLSGRFKDDISLGGLSLLFAVMVTVVSIMLFYQKQDSMYLSREANYQNSVIVKNIPQEYLENLLKNIEFKGESRSEIDFKGWLSILCYIMSLSLYLYSLYILQKERSPTDPAALSRKNAKTLSRNVTEVFGE
ncbi:hypothetical protein ACFO3I_03375 [Rheinheimera marina]|uniref:DUF4199 domain-containing protein n=1 Tax=Rheinheimera marina TaxID=1774958 RepID=A0ABV9JJN6_9GAMM